MPLLKGLDSDAGLIGACDSLEPGVVSQVWKGPDE